MKVIIQGRLSITPPCLPLYLRRGSKILPPLELRGGRGSYDLEVLNG
jgi:hypothetical protein